MAMAGPADLAGGPGGAPRSADAGDVLGGIELAGPVDGAGQPEGV
jgi:hypothetical protein